MHADVTWKVVVPAPGVPDGIVDDRPGAFPACWRLWGRAWMGSYVRVLMGIAGVQPVEGCSVFMRRCGLGVRKPGTVGSRAAASVDGGRSGYEL